MARIFGSALWTVSRWTAFSRANCLLARERRIVIVELWGSPFGAPLYRRLRASLSYTIRPLLSSTFWHLLLLWTRSCGVRDSDEVRNLFLGRFFTLHSSKESESAIGCTWNGLSSIPELIQGELPIRSVTICMTNQAAIFASSSII